jgi:ElaB/YqjD/DUF883 family membrane-anchored ribosome-binding protein
MSTQELKNDLKQATREVENLISNVSANSAAAVGNLRDSIDPLLQSAKDSLNALGQGVRTRAVSAAHKTDEYAHANPWQIAGISAAVGLTIGFLLGRRN